MTQPSASERGPGDKPRRRPDARADTPGPDGDQQVLRLSDFASGGVGDTCPPGPELAAALAALSGSDWRCAGASDEELIGLLNRWGALEAWTAAGKMGVVRELLRRRAGRGLRPGGQGPDALPRSWHEGTGHEVAAALAMSLQGADKLVDLSWELGARLPGVAARLADGTIDALKARLIVSELRVLDDEHAAQAEALIVGELAGKTASLIGKLAAQAAAAVDPEGSEKRRERAEREEARVRFWRENSGACALAAYGLPADAALAANAAIAARARRYKKAKVCPDATMDQLRVLAFLDIVNGVSEQARIARARAEQARAQAQAQTGASAGSGDQQPGQEHGGPRGSAAGDTDGPGDDGRCDARPADDWPGDDDQWPSDDYCPADDNRPADDNCPDDHDCRHDDCWPGDDDWPADDDQATAADRIGADGGDGPGDGGDGSCGGSGAAPGAGDAGPELAASINLTIPLATVLGQAQRPGLGHGLGPIDPALARDLAAVAARSPHSRWCVTVVADGIAVGHGCARPARKRKDQGKPSPAQGGGVRDGPPGRPRDGTPAFTARDDPGPPGGYGTWTLTLPGGRDLEVSLLPIPVTDCDHRYETSGYQPSDLLRHLVQVRDGVCTFPCCSRHARESDFEHAIPHDHGGRTCLCNAGARSRRCHRVKQSNGWSVTQPRPGWHQWTTPSGRTYTQEPMKYPI